MSFSDRAKAKEPKRVTLEEWLDTLPDTERAGAEHMLRTPKLWSLPELVEEFRAEGATFGRDQFSKWRRDNSVVRH